MSHLLSEDPVIRWMRAVQHICSWHQSTHIPNSPCTAAPVEHASLRLDGNVTALTQPQTEQQQQSSAQQKDCNWCTLCCNQQAAWVMQTGQTTVASIEAHNFSLAQHVVACSLLLACDDVAGVAMNASAIKWQVKSQCIRTVSL